jgi:hypothetical protein
MKWWTLQLMATYCSDRIQWCPFLFIFCQIRIVSVTHWWTYATNKFYISLYISNIYSRYEAVVKFSQECNICHYRVSTHMTGHFRHQFLLSLRSNFIFYKFDQNIDEIKFKFEINEFWNFNYKLENGQQLNYRF